MGSLTFPLTFGLTAVDKLSFGLTAGVLVEGNFIVGAAESFIAELQTTLVPRWAAAGTPTFTRNLAAYVEDFEGRLVSVPANAARMAGTRIVQQLLVDSEDFSTANWTKQANVSVSGTQSVTFSAAANSAIYQSYVAPATVLSFRGSIYVQGPVGKKVQIGNQPNGATPTFATITLDGTKQLVTSAVALANGGAGDFNFSIDGSQETGFPFTVTLSGAQLENVTGQTNQSPSERVASGVSYGLGANSIRSFDTLNGNTVASNVVTEATGPAINSSTSKFAVLPGQSGSQLSTPHAAANTIPGDNDIRAFIAPASWVPAVANVIAGKWGVGSNQMFVFYINTDGTLELDPGTGAGTKSSVATGFAAGTAWWVRVTWASATGFLNYYTSPDGITWTLLGAANRTSTGTFNGGTNSLYVGAEVASSSAPFNGRIDRFQMLNGINGTLAVDFNPNDSTSAQTWTSATTGEVWTTNGNARVFGNTNATYGIPAQWDANGSFGYLAEASAQNLQRYSEVPAASDWITQGSHATITPNAYVARNGTTTTAQLLASAGNFTHFTNGNTANLTFTTTVTPTTVSATLQYVNNRWVSIALNDGVASYYAVFDLLNGVAGATGAGVTSTIKSTAQANVYSITLTVTPTATASAFLYVFLENANSFGITWNAAGTEACGFGSLNVVASSVATSPILTTTTAVTRPADVLSYPASGNIASTMSLAQQITPSTALGSATVFHWSSYVDANNYTAILSDGTNLIARKRISGSNHDATIAWSRTVGTVAKVAARFDTVNGSDIWLNGVKGTNDATTTAAQIGSTFEVGGDGNGANQDYSYHRLLHLWKAALSDTVLNSKTL